MHTWRAFRRSGRRKGCACVLRPCRPAPAPAPASRCWPGSSRCRSPRCRAATTRRGGPSSKASARLVSRSAGRGFWSPPKTPASSAFATGLRRASAGRSRTRRRPASPSRSRQACAATCRRRRMAQSGMRALRISSRSPACISASWPASSSRPSGRRSPSGRAWRSDTRSRNGRPRPPLPPASSTCCWRARRCRRSAPSSWSRSPCWRYWWTGSKSACALSRWRPSPCWLWIPMRSPPRASSSPSPPSWRWSPSMNGWPRRWPSSAPGRGARRSSWPQPCSPPSWPPSRPPPSRRIISAASPPTGLPQT